MRTFHSTYQPFMSLGVVEVSAQRNVLNESHMNRIVVATGSVIEKIILPHSKDVIGEIIGIGNAATHGLDIELLPHWGQSIDMMSRTTLPFSNTSLLMAYADGFVIYE